MRSTNTNTAPSERHGLLAPSDSLPQSALASGLLSGAAITTAMLLAFTLAGIAFEGMTEGLAICLSAIVAGMAGGLLQQVCFNPRVLNVRLSYAARIALFGVTDFVVLASCAHLGGWFPPSAVTWITFTVIYLAIFVVLSAAFSVRYRRETALYAERLAAYRSRQEHKE